MEPAEGTNPDMTSEAETSASTVKVHNRRNLGDLLSRLTPVGSERQSELETSTGEESTETRKQRVPAAPTSSPVLESVTPAPHPKTSTSGKNLRLSSSGFPPELSCEDNAPEQVIDSLSNTERPISQPTSVHGDSPLGYTPVKNSPVSASSPQAEVHGSPRSRITAAVATFLSSSPSSLPFTDAPRAYLAVLPFAIAVVLGLVVLVLLAFSSSHHVSPLTEPTVDIEQDARVLCTSVACREVLSLLALTADRSVPPCDDFYQHVCGNWAAAVSPSHAAAEPDRLLNYEEANLRSFNDRVHRSLIYLSQKPSRSPAQESQMARFYKSCFYSVSHQTQTGRLPSIQVVLDRAEIDRHLWEHARSLLDLLESAVSSCLRTGLTTVLSARRSQNGDVFLDLGDSLRHTLRADRGEDRVRRFLNESFLNLRQDRRSYSEDEILTLDAKVEDVRKVFDASKQLFKVVQPSELPSPLSELPSLAERTKPGHVSTTSMHQQSFLRVRSLKKIVQVIEHLGSVNIRLAGEYLLLVIASQVLKYGYLLLTPHGQRNDQVAVEVCLQAIAEHFTHRFPVWLASTMETAEAHYYINSMVAALGRSAASKTSVAQSLLVNGSTFARISLETNTARSGALDQEASTLAEDFLFSVIQLRRQPLARDWLSAEAAAHSQLRGDVLIESSGADTTVTAPSLFLTGDLLHPVASDESVDYSTVGVRLLVAWANHEATVDRAGNATSANNTTAYRRCIADHGALAVGQQMGEDTLQAVLFLPWALEVALDAATWTTTSQRHLVDVLGAKQRLFFRRFCQAMCGDSRMAAACRYGVLHSETFASAFGCSREPLQLPC